MIDLDDGEQLLDLLGIVLGLLILGGVALLLFTAMNGIPSQQDTAPDGDWTLDRVNTTHVRITYRGDELIAAENLSVTVNGRQRPVSWSERLTRGDAGVLRAREDETVRVYWTGGRGDRVLLKRW